MALEREDKRLVKLGDRLRFLREQYSKKVGRKIYQRSAAIVAGVNEDQYRSYEYGRAELPISAARLLAAEWGIGWEDFYKVEGIASRRRDEVSAPMIPVPKLLVPIPYVGNVGANSEADWLDPVETGELIDVPNEMATPLGPTSVRFACTVIGDSCYDLLWPGDTAVFHKSNTPRIGHMILFRSDNNTVTIKQLKHDGKAFYLHPLNSAYEDCPAHGMAVGYLVGIVRQSGSKRVTVYDEYGIVP